MARALYKIDTLYLQPWHRSVRGFWIPAGPVLTLADTVDDEGVGESVTTVLSIVRRDAPWPPPDEVDPLCVAVLAEDLADACTGAAVVEIEEDDGKFTLTPTRLKGTTLEPVPGKALEFAHPHAAGLGAALREAFRRAR